MFSRVVLVLMPMLLGIEGQSVPEELCLPDGSCVRPRSEAQCVDSASDEAESFTVDHVTQLTVRGETVCALWIWLLEGSSVSVIWNGQARGFVGANDCLELYAQPGYTMDTSNVTLVSVGGAIAAVSTNPPTVECDGDGDLVLTPAAKAGIVLGSLLCLFMSAALLVCCCRALVGTVRYATVDSAANDPAPLNVVVAPRAVYGTVAGEPVMGQPVVAQPVAPAALCSAAPVPPALQAN